MFRPWGQSRLQYIELSNNKVKDIAGLVTLTNMASLYLGNNQISDLPGLENEPALIALPREQPDRKHHRSRRPARLDELVAQQKQD